MNEIIYYDTDRYMMGISLKNDQLPEANNMALHVCNDKQMIIQNRQQLAQAVKSSIEHFVCANQTHSEFFYKVTEKDRGSGAFKNATAIQNVDALYTYEPNILLTTFHADCVPIIFCHEHRGLVGVIHSGWQGTVKEITYKLFKYLIDEEQCSPDGFRIHIGRALSQEKFEVDADVYQKFQQLDYAEPYMYLHDETNKYHIDNQQVVKQQCLNNGISIEQIEIDTTCTFMDSTSFSYREDRQCGRHMSFIMKKDV